jgi:hypothetical protein
MLKPKKKKRNTTLDAKVNQKLESMKSDLKVTAAEVAQPPPAPHSIAPPRPCKLEVNISMTKAHKSATKTLSPADLKIKVEMAIHKAKITGLENGSFMESVKC